MPTPTRYSYFGWPARSGPPLYDHWPKDDGEWVRYEDHAVVVGELVEALQATRKVLLSTPFDVSTHRTLAQITAALAKVTQGEG